MRKKIVRAVGSIVFAACLLMGAQAEADLLPINNPGFEDLVLQSDQFTTHIGTGFVTQILTATPIPGWVVVGLGGTWRPSSGPFPSGPPEGLNTAWVELNSIHSTTVFQVLADVLTADTVYTLTVSAGHRRDIPLAPYSVQLVAGGALLNEGTDDSIPTGEFRTVTVSFTAPPDHPQLGQALEIRLVVIADRQEVNFDDVKLDATPQ